MALIRWEPVRELNTIQNEVNRLFNTFFDTATPGNGGSTLRRWIPAMDLVETENDFILRADLPGLSEQDVQIELEDNVLTLSGAPKVAISVGSDTRTIDGSESTGTPAVESAAPAGDAAEPAGSAA
jgi:HSP20 family protein